VFALGEETSMRVHKVVAPVSGAVSWTVVDECFEPVEPVEVYLAHLEAIERSPNTLRSYASSLRLFFEFLARRQLAWDTAGLDELGRFVSWLRQPAEKVVPLHADSAARAASTVNRHLAAVFGFYDFHARRGVDVAAALVGLAPGRARRLQAVLGRGGRAFPVGAEAPGAAASPLTHTVGLA